MLHTKDIFADWTKVGTMLLVSRWLTGESLTDRDWQMSSLYTLVGFTSYHLSTRNFIDTELAGEYKNAADTWTKVGTMMIVSRLLSGGNPLDATWLKASLFTLIGFTVYDIIISKFVKGSALSNNPKIAAAINDWANVGTMLLVSRLLSCESLVDPKWAMGSIATLVGFTAFDLGTSHLLDAVFN